MSDISQAIRIKPEQGIAEAKALGEKIAKGTKLFEEIRDEHVEIAALRAAAESYERIVESLLER